jgi:uncharacterized protein (DUF2249 family)
MIPKLFRAPGEPAATAMPEALAALPESRRVELDVRGDIAKGEEPFARIMAAANRLAAGEVLVLRTPFEPIPLYGVLGKRGLAHWTEQRAEGCTVWFYRAEQRRCTVTLDVRSLEPPLPMVLVLERLDVLGADEELEIIHDRRPMLLYPQLDDRGFVHETDESRPGLVRIRVRHGTRPATR